MLGHQIISAALAGALVLAACGSDGGADLERAALAEAPPTDEATSSTEISPEPVAAGSEEATAAAESTEPGEPAPTAAVAPRLAKAPPAGSPEEMAERITLAETTVRDPSSPPDALAARAFELQQLYRQLARTGEWHAPVNDLLSPELRRAMHHNVSARNQFRAMHRSLSGNLPAWRIIDPPPAEELLSYYKEAEATFGVPWNVLAAVNLVETGMGRIRGTSVAGAQGPMQFMPATWEAFGDGGDVNDFHDAIMGAARYLAHNGGGSGNIDGALWNYNHSDRYVEGVKHYAAVMGADPQTFHGYYHWQVVYLSAAGDVWLPTGYDTPGRVSVADYVARAPHLHLSSATN